MSTIYGELARKGIGAVESGFKTLFIVIIVLVVILLAAGGTIIYLLVR